MLLSEVFWVVMNGMIKYLSDDFSTVQLLFFRNLIPIPTMLILLAVMGNLPALKTTRPLLHLSVGLIGAIGMAALIYSLSFLSLSQAVSITYAAPLMITALSVPMLKEKVGFRRWAGVIVGFTGVLVLARPDAGLNPIVLILLASTLCFSLVVVLRRRLSMTDDSAVIVFYFSITVVVCASVFLPWYWHQPDLRQWVLLLVMGTFAVGAQFFMMQAIKHAPVSVIAPLLYFSLVFAVSIDIMYWGVVPDQTTLLGASIIIAAGLYVIYRESGLSKKTNKGN
jgi:drug/metabolite transporter (DMT)-like permease